MKVNERIIRGRKARAAGQRFERKVRADLESKGWIVSKWQNNVEFKDFADPNCIHKGPCECSLGKCVPAKMGKFRTNQGGFPDFIIFKLFTKDELFDLFTLDIFGSDLTDKRIRYEIILVEVKSSGYLTKEEKEKAKWYLKNKYCSVFIVASKGEKRGEIVYKYFK